MFYPLAEKMMEKVIETHTFKGEGMVFAYDKNLVGLFFMKLECVNN